jgi:hypothetical protein
MDEKEPNFGLKGWVLVSKTINTGRYNSVKLEMGTEFLAENHKHEDIAESFLAKIDRFAEKHALRQHLD